MTGLTISELPHELLYTILSHALADILFDFLFVGALVPNNHKQPKAAANANPGLNEISSLAGVSVAWRITVQRILGAVLNIQQHSNQDVQSLQTQHHVTASSATSTPSIHYSRSVSAEAVNAVTCIDSTKSVTLASSLISSLPQSRNTLLSMQGALRQLVQQSIDTYRSEQDALAHTGVTTPTLLPVPPMQTPPLPSTPPVVPHSIPSLLPPQAHLGGAAVHGQVSGQQLAALIQAMPPAMKIYATNPIFHEALCYSQAAIFTCSSSSAFPPCTTPAMLRRKTAGITRVQRPDLSTLSLTSGRLTAALEWTHKREAGNRICPREIGEVADCGMREIRERIDDATQVCRWNDLLDSVFLHGERSEELLDALDGCFDELEANAGTIQMQHLLRSNLFKTVQTIARLSPISFIGAPAGGANASPARSNGEAWKSRAAALAFRWTGRVIEWTGV